MQRSCAGQALVALVYVVGCGLVGCGSGEDTATSPPMFVGNSPGGNGMGVVPAAPVPAPTTTTPAVDTPATNEAVAPNLGLDPASPTPAPDTIDPDVPAIALGNGRVVGGNCTLVCADASTDPDAQGATDGWGYEQNRSCVTPESALATANEACDIPELVPVPPVPVQIPEGNTPRPVGNLSTGFFVANGRLFDRMGFDFVMRGINHPVAWFARDAIEWLDEIASTGANSVRLVWETDRGSTDLIRASIEHAVELGMVPMVELHDITGSQNVNDPQRMAQYYVDDMRDILREFEPYLLVNIANEWGSYQTTADTWVQAYRQAITVLRDGGINNTLVIDANEYGQRGSTIVNRGAELLDHDPQHNILFSTHMYQSYENRQTILDVMRGAQNARLPLIVGEFGFQHGSRNGQPIPVPYEVMLDEAARLGMGYLAWSWTGNSQDVGYLDMTENGSAGQLTGWGDDIINGTNGIRSTSERAGMFGAP